MRDKVTEPVVSRAPRRWLAAVIAAAAVAGLVGIGLFVWALAYLGFFSFTQPTLGDALAGFDAAGPAVEDTPGLCGSGSGRVNCVEGWRTGVGNFMRFSGDSLAEYWHLTIGGDSLRNGNVVVDMNGLDLTRDERELAVQLLFPGRDWD